MAWEPEPVQTIAEAVKLLEEEIGAQRVTVRLPKAEIIEVAKKICAVYSQGKHTIENCCKAFGVKYWTFQAWAQPDLTKEEIESGEKRKGLVVEVHELYKESKRKGEQAYFLRLKHKTRAGIEQAITGVEVEETETTVKQDANGQLIPTGVTRRTKRILPHPTLLMFVAKNVDGDNFSDKIQTEHSGSVEVKNPYAGMSLEQIAAEREKLNNNMTDESEV